LARKLHYFEKQNDYFLPRRKYNKFTENYINLGCLILGVLCRCTSYQAISFLSFKMEDDRGFGGRGEKGRGRGGRRRDRGYRDRPARVGNLFSIEVLFEVVLTMVNIEILFLKFQNKVSLLGLPFHSVVFETCIFFSDLTFMIY